MEDKKICKKCNKEIKNEEKGVTWITFKGKKQLEVIHWHFKCFIEWRNESLENRAKKLYFNSMKNTMPKFQEIMQNVFHNRENQIYDSNFI